METSIILVTIVVVSNSSKLCHIRWITIVTIIVLIIDKIAKIVISLLITTTIIILSLTRVCWITLTMFSTRIAMVVSIMVACMGSCSHRIIKMQSWVEYPETTIIIITIIIKVTPTVMWGARFLTAAITTTTL